jgi:hypothetical protein
MNKWTQQQILVKLYIKKISIELGNGKNINLFGCHSDCHSRVSRE